MGAMDMAADGGGANGSADDRREGRRHQPIPADGGTASGLPRCGEDAGACQGYDTGGGGIAGARTSMQPGVTRPLSLLVTELGTGAFLVQDYQTGTSAYISPADSEPLREALDTAFGDKGVPMDIPPIVRPRV